MFIQKGTAPFDKRKEKKGRRSEWRRINKACRTILSENNNNNNTTSDGTSRNSFSLVSMLCEQNYAEIKYSWMLERWMDEKSERGEENEDGDGEEDMSFFVFVPFFLFNHRKKELRDYRYRLTTSPQSLKQREQKRKEFSFDQHFHTLADQITIEVVQCRMHPPLRCASHSAKHKANWIHSADRCQISQSDWSNLTFSSSSQWGKISCIAVTQGRFVDGGDKGEVMLKNASLINSDVRRIHQAIIIDNRRRNAIGKRYCSHARHSRW